MQFNILQDENFENGLKLKGLNSIKDGHSCKKIIEGNGKVPNWFLCQWNSKYDMCIDGMVEKTENGYRFYDKSKCAEVDKKGKIILSLDASKECTAPRKPEEPWPHILLEQDIEPYVKISNIKSLRVKGTFELKEFIDYMNGENKEHHTTQFVWVTVIKNINEKSPDFGHFIWVVMSILDSRYDITPLYCAQDKALPDGEFIYSFSSDGYMTGKLEVGAPQTIDFDLYPNTEKILLRAQKAKYLQNTTIDDLAVTGMNFGFEITGTYSSTISVDKPQLLIEEK